MADYIYLLENRLSGAQKRALSTVREIARTKGLTVFLVGGAVRDLTSGSPVRDLDVVVQGNALKLKKDLHKSGALLSGEMEAGQALFVSFPGNVRMELGSTLSATYPKPGKPVLKPATILDDLRRRDFTANAMALSLNEGSYGLLMDPLNGVADIENRELRLVSNYGFIEDPVRLVRAARFVARLGWQLEEKTRARYETGKSEGYITALQSFHRGYEAEEIVHEEDPLRVIRGLERDGWMKRLVPAWGAAKVNVAELEKLRETQAQLQMQGIHADPSAAQFPLLTAKMAAPDVRALKKSFPRQGFVAEINALDGEAKKLAAELLSKAAAKPSATWKMLMAARPEAVLWVAYSTKNSALQAKFQSFYTEWPQARQRIPYVQMQEMRIVPGLAGFDELVEKIFFELIDGKLGTVEEMKAFLEPYSPPAPPPTVHLRRARAAKKETKAKARKKAETDEGHAAEAEAAVGSASATGVASAKAEAVRTEASTPAERKAAAAMAAAAKKEAAAKAAAAKKEAAAKAAAAKKEAAVKAAAAKKEAAAKAAAAKKEAAAKAVAAKKEAAAKAVAAKKVAAAKAAEAKKKAAAVKKEAAAKATAAKKVAATRAAEAKKKAAVTKKAVAAKKVSSKKAVAKKAPVKKTSTKKAVAKKVSAKAPAKKTKPAKKTTTKKAAAKRVAKSPAKRAPAKKR